MDMEELKKNLEEALKYIDILSQERDNLKERCEDEKVYIGKLKDKIDYLKFKKEYLGPINDSDEVSILKKQN